MDSSNVAKVFAPNLLHAFQEDATQAFEETPQATQLMQTLIDQFDDLFHVPLWFVYFVIIRLGALNRSSN